MRPLTLALAALALAATDAAAQTDGDLVGVWRTVSMGDANGVVATSAGIIVFTPSGEMILASEEHEEVDARPETCFGTYTVTDRVIHMEPDIVFCPMLDGSMTTRFAVTGDELVITSSSTVTRLRRVGARLP